MISKYCKIYTLVLILVGFQTAFAQYADRMVAAEPNDVTVIYNNGGVSTGATTESGVAAPDGYTWSENQHDTGNTTEVNNLLGFGATLTTGGNRLADNFTVPAGQTWTITSVSVQGFVANWTAPVSPFSGAALQIWNGVPGAQGSNVVFGDLTTNRLASATPSNVYVIRNTVVQPTTQNFSRPLWKLNMSVATPLTLGPGTYWIDFQATAFNNAAVFFRNVVVPGTRGQASWNARQYFNSTDVWQPIVDDGTPASAPDVPQDIAFEISGFNAARQQPTFMDYDGDGTSDFAVTRWGAQGLTSWYIYRNNGSGTAHSYAQFGRGAGTNRAFTGLGIQDIVLPADYDGDGKTDIAVYRSGTFNPPGTGSTFHIINSSDNTVRSEQWGANNDIANIMGDYDGDGKADLAVWRQGTTAEPQSFYYVKKSSDGGMMAIPWGQRGDRAVLGDFDGDGKMDFSVARIDATTGEAVLYTRQSSNNQMTATDLNYPFLFIVPADYDGDGKTDIATINNSLDKFLWRITRSSDGVTEAIESGRYSTDYPAPGDYNGDGKADIAVFRKQVNTTEQAYFIFLDSDGVYKYTPWGSGFDHSVATIRVY